jgi:taurine transport system substrate-binding protein
MLKTNPVKVMLSIFTLMVCACFTGAAVSAAGPKPNEVTVAYLPQWPTPSHFSRVKMIFDEALGVKVNWVPFASGSEINAAIAAGEVQIAYSQQHLPFLVGVADGLDLSMVAIAVSYPENDNCIVHNDANINQANAVLLEGRKVATRIGSVSHYRLLKMLEHLGVDPANVEIVPMPDDAASAYALQQGYVAMACASGSALRSMSSAGEPLMTGAELEAIGLRLFDMVAVPTSFTHEHPEIVQAFVDVTEASNEQWMKNPDPMQAAIASAAGMDPESMQLVLQSLEFPPAEEQKSIAWMKGLVPAYTQDLAEFLVEQGQLDKALDSYNRHITTRFLR